MAHSYLIHRLKVGPIKVNFIEKMGPAKSSCEVCVIEKCIFFLPKYRSF